MRDDELTTDKDDSEKLSQMELSGTGTPGLVQSSDDVVDDDEGPKPLDLTAQDRLVKYLEKDKEIDKKVLVRGRLLGKGTFGEVYEGTYCGVPVAIKELHPGADRNGIKSFILEGETLRNLHHPFICEYVGHTTSPYSVVTRRYPRDLFNAVNTGGSGSALELEDKFRIAYQLAAALLYLHKNNILHRDIKPENILLDENNNVRLADFGLSQYAPGLVYDPYSPPGSKLYMAPEILTQHAFDTKCEVYTYGLMLFFIFTGRGVYERAGSVHELIECQKQPNPLLLTDDDCSKNYGDGLAPSEFWEFAKQCWSYYPEERPTMEDVISNIVAIGVHAAIPKSRPAENFWLQCSSSVYRDSLLFSEVTPYVKILGKPEDGLTKPEEFIELIRKAIPHCGNSLRIKDFWNLCCWFPNFFASRESLERMKGIVSASWFTPDETKVMMRLDKSKSDVFVVRTSPTDPFSSPFTVCTEIRGKPDYHHVIRRFDKNTNRQYFTCNSLIYGRPFMSIFDLVDHIVEDLKLSIADPCDGTTHDRYASSTELPTTQ